MPDAVIGKTVSNIIGSAFGAAGQRCMAGSVVVAVGDAKQPLLDELVRRTRELTVGDGLERGTDVGPVVSEPARDRILDWIDRGIAGGATRARRRPQAGRGGGGRVRRPDHPRRRHPRHGDRPGGGLRAGALGHPRRLARRGDRDRERQPLRQRHVALHRVGGGRAPLPARRPGRHDRHQHRRRRARSRSSRSRAGRARSSATCTPTAPTRSTSTRARRRSPRASSRAARPAASSSRRTTESARAVTAPARVRSEHAASMRSSTRRRLRSTASPIAPRGRIAENMTVAGRAVLRHQPDQDRGLRRALLPQHRRLPGRARDGRDGRRPRPHRGGHRRRALGRGRARDHHARARQRGGRRGRGDRRADRRAAAPRRASRWSAPTAWASPPRASRRPGSAACTRPSSPGPVATLAHSGSIGEILVSLGPRVGFRTVISAGNETRHRRRRLRGVVRRRPRHARRRPVPRGRAPAGRVRGGAARGWPRPARWRSCSRSARPSSAPRRRSRTPARWSGPTAGSRRCCATTTRSGSTTSASGSSTSRCSPAARPPRGRRIGAVTNSGGEGEYFADKAEQAGIPLRALLRRAARAHQGRVPELHPRRQPGRLLGDRRRPRRLPARVRADGRVGRVRRAGVGDRPQRTGCTAASAQLATQHRRRPAGRRRGHRPLSRRRHGDHRRPAARGPALGRASTTSRAQGHPARPAGAGRPARP